MKIMMQDNRPASKIVIYHSNGKAVKSNIANFDNDGKSAWLMIRLDEMPNLDHIETVAGSKEQFYVDWELADTRRVRKKQRRLFFALLNDISDYFVVPPDYLKGMFYLQYAKDTQAKRSV